MKAALGDRIVVVPPHVGGAARDGVVVELRHPDGSPPYVVEWSDDHRRCLYFPGPDGHVEHPVAAAGLPAPRPEVPHVTTWTVTVHVYEQGSQTSARAVLHAGSGSELEARGTTHRAPRELDVPEIGQEVAVSRALQQLADTLLATAAVDLREIRAARTRA